MSLFVSDIGAFYGNGAFYGKGEGNFKMHSVKCTMNVRLFKHCSLIFCIWHG